MATVSAALGTFDGLHEGHIGVLKSAILSGNAICVTFSYPPSEKDRAIIQPHVKLKRLKAMGFKEVISLDFKEVKDISPKQFLDMLNQKYGVTNFCCGFDYRFGKGGMGNTETLIKYCNDNRCTATVVPQYTRNGTKISSTDIREFIESGEIEKANALLSEPYSLEMPVIHGDARGRTLGYPTLNQPLPSGICKMKFGVYISKVMFDGVTYKGITNVGVRPTYLSKTPLCETYIIGFKGDAYGKTITLMPEKFVREEEKFHSVTELKNAIEHDVKIAEYY